MARRKFTPDEKKLLLQVFEWMDAVAPTVEPDAIMTSPAGHYLMTRAQLSEFVRRCYKSALERV